MEYFNLFRAPLGARLEMEGRMVRSLTAMFTRHRYCVDDRSDIGVWSTGCHFASNKDSVILG